MGELDSINDYCTKLSTNNDITDSVSTTGSYSILTAPYWSGITTNSCSTIWSSCLSDIASNTINKIKDTIDNKLHINVKSCKLFLNFTL